MSYFLAILLSYCVHCMNIYMMFICECSLKVLNPRYKLERSKQDNPQQC
jgi:hypothetical protein